MSENKTYENVNGSRFEVNKMVYHAYHKKRKWKYYKDKQFHTYNLYLEKILKDRKIIEDKYINKKILQRLKVALKSLAEEKRYLFVCFFL